MAELPIKTRAISVEDFDKVGDALPSTLGQTMEASFSLANMDTAVGTLARMFSLDEAKERQGFEKLTKDQLNERFRDDGVSFNEDMNILAAQTIVDRHREKARLQEIINSGPQTGVSKVAQFGAGALASMMDPIEATAGILVGAGLGKLALSGGAASKFIPKGGVGLAATEGVIESTALEFGVAAANKQEQMDYTMADALSNIAMGTTGHVGFYGLVKGASRASSFLTRLTPSQRLANFKGYMGQLLTGKKPDIDPINRQHLRELGGKEGSSTEIRYTHEPITEIKGKRFHHGSREYDVDLSKSNVVIEDDFGDALYLSDNPNVANGHAINSIDNSGGTVKTVELDDLRVLDADNAFPEEAFDGVDMQDIDLSQSGKAVMDDVRSRMETGAMPDDTVARINSNIRKSYDAISHTGGGYLGADTGRHNVLAVLNRDKVREIESFDARRDQLYDPSDEDLAGVTKRFEDDKTDLFYDQQTIDEFQEEFDSFERDYLNNARKAIEENESKIAELEQAGELDAEMQAEINKMQMDDIRGEQEDALIKGLFDCILRNI